MISGTTRKLDLYDLFSVLLPGGAVLLAFIPFLPRDYNLDPTILISVLVFLGYVVGRGMHALAVEIEDAWESIPTHRERFQQEIRSPDYLSEAMVSQFLRECGNEFDIIDTDGEGDEIDSDDLSDSEIDDLYTLVRSYIHIDSRGRSRTFQAIYAFYRGMWIASLAIAMGYLLYGYLASEGFFESNDFYVSYFGNLGLEPIFIWYGVAFVAYIGHRTFRVARADYQKVYTQYLISDFLILQGVDYPEAIVTAERIEN